MRFQLTEEWRAVYGRRYLSFSELNVARHRFPWISRFQNGSPDSRKKT
jgi:hypothetical protein